MQSTVLLIAPAVRATLMKGYVEGAARRLLPNHTLTVVDPNRLARSGLVLTQIAAEIETATLVVADLTARNPNVYYEIAVADSRKDLQRVILVARQDEEIGYDLQARRLLFFEESLQGMQRFEAELAEFMRQGLERSGGPWFETIEGRIERTRRIVADLKLLKDSSEGVADLAIRFEGSLTPLAICDDEDSGEVAYRALLLQEREAMIALTNAGAKFRAIVGPRIRLASPGRAEGKKYLQRRLNRLREILEGNAGRDIHLDCIEIALLEPGYVRNAYLLGNAVVYDGIKASIGGGFDLTTRLTEPRQIQARTSAFDGLFRDATEYTMQRWGDGGPADAHALRRASVRGLRELLDAHAAETSLTS
jgi:hypothetical protein